MDEIIGQAKKSKIVQSEVSKEISKFKNKTLAEQSQLLKSRTSDTIVYREAINIMGDRIIELEDESEIKEKENELLRNYIGKVPEKLEDTINFEKIDILHKRPSEKRERMVNNIKKMYQRNKQLQLE